MSSAAITTLVKMMETLPEGSQDQVVEHVRDYIAEMQDEQQGDIAFQRSQKQLIAAARRAKQEIAAGKTEAIALWKTSPSPSAQGCISSGHRTPFIPHFTSSASTLTKGSGQFGSPWDIGHLG